MKGPLPYLRSRAADSILRHYRETSHPHVELVPRARAGLHAIAQTCLAPGDRVLISPVTCHTVMEAFLQAGVVPLFTDIHPGDGNIDVSRLTPRTLGRVKAILTTNLYGNPDDAGELAVLARRHNLLLIEDCAHVFESTVEGRPIGSIGDLSVFSFKKFFDVPGGVVAGRDPRRVEIIRNWLLRSCRFPTGPREAAGWARGVARRAAGGGLLRDVRHRVGEWRAGRPEEADIVEGRAPSRETDAIPRVNLSDFLVMPLLDDLNRVAGFLDHLERFREDWDRGNRELILRAPLEYRRSPHPSTVVHMTVPFSSPQRDVLLAHLRGRGIPIWFLYNPPMNYLYSGAISAEPSLDLDRLEEWRRRILPLPGRHAGRILSLLVPAAMNPVTPDTTAPRAGT